MQKPLTRIFCIFCNFKIIVIFKIEKHRVFYALGAPFPTPIRIIKYTLTSVTGVVTMQI